MSSPAPSVDGQDPADAHTPTVPRDGHRLDVGTIQVAAETFGHLHDVAIVLVMGATASMLWWPTDLCEALVRSGFRVIRYDHRDTGRTTTGDPGDVGYSVEDLTGDLIGVLDALDIGTAHLVGMSLGGTIGQIAALRHPDRVRSLTLIGSEPLGSSDELPGIDDTFMAHFAGMRELDWTDEEAVEEFLVQIGRLSAGKPGRFDEVGTRDRVRAEISRAVDIASAFNHTMVMITDDWTDAVDRIRKPTLVIHGVDDPILPLPNGRSLAARVEGARFCALEDAGHELNPLDLATIGGAISAFLHDVDAEGPG